MIRDYNAEVENREAEEKQLLKTQFNEKFSRYKKSYNPAEDVSIPYKE